MKNQNNVHICTGKSLTAEITFIQSVLLTNL